MNNGLRCAALSDQGLVRSDNQDRWFADAESGLFFVCDGMGGHRSGAIASESVLQRLPGLVDKLVPPGAGAAVLKGMRSAVVELSVGLRLSGREQAGCFGMGATVVVMLVRDGCAIVAHLGDSRAYRYAAGRLEMLTHDHTFTQYLIDLGEITAEETRSHPARGKLSRYVGMTGEVLTDVMSIPVTAGDRFVLCSDGLTKMLCDDVIADLLGTHKTPSRACRALIEEAKLAGGRDNVTAIVIDHG